MKTISSIICVTTVVSPLYQFKALSDFINKTLIPIDTALLDTSLTKPNDELLEKAIEYIEKNYANDLTREEVANYIHISPPYFSRYFKQYTGCSFLEYLTKIRIKNAIELLKTDTKIEKISSQVGYQSINRFFINFKKLTSYSPAQYKRYVLNSN